jgi:hypothetical protein
MRQTEKKGNVEKLPIPEDVKKSVEMLMDLYPDRVPELVHHMCSYWMDKQEEKEPETHHVVICSFNSAKPVPEKSTKEKAVFVADIRTFLSGSYLNIESALSDLYEDCPKLSIIRDARGMGIDGQALQSLVNAM